MDTAVILCARREKESQIPFPLIPFSEGVTLLKRTLSILAECGFRKIFIVVGFRKELFEPYSSPEIQIIVNPDYEFTSSMGSLACCKGLINDDFILIEGDTFFEKKVIERLCSVSNGNCLTMTEESGSGDECFVETKHDYVTRITKDRHRVCNFEGELIGISRISYSTFTKMIELWEYSTNSYLNYEYVLMDVTDPLDRPVLKFKNLLWGDVDCREDFKRLKNSLYRSLQRKENPYDEGNLRQHLKQIFPESDVDTSHISQMGGMSNKNFLVDLDGKKYVLRIPGNGSAGMVERRDEEFNASEASRIGVNPPLRYFDAVSGIKLVDYIENAETLNAATIQRHDNMRKIAEIYKKVHQSHIRLRNEFNIFHEIEKYDRLLINASAQMYEGWEEVREKVMALEKKLNLLGVDLKPCHNDALYENFIKSEDGRIFLIDWEYSGMNDPLADMAALFLEADFEEENIDYFLNKYFDGEVPHDTKLKILCYQILWDYLWAQWTVIKEKNGDDFGTYGIDRFNRAISNINKLNNDI